MQVTNLADFNLAVGKADRQTAKFNSMPNFPAIRYIIFALPCMRSKLLLKALTQKNTFHLYNIIMLWPYTMVLRRGILLNRDSTAEPVLPSWFDEILHKYCMQQKLQHVVYMFVVINLL